jgi:hypothetical protein
VCARAYLGRHDHALQSADLLVGTVARALRIAQLLPRLRALNGSNQHMMVIEINWGSRDSNSNIEKIDRLIWFFSIENSKRKIKYAADDSDHDCILSFFFFFFSR